MAARRRRGVATAFVEAGATTIRLDKDPGYAGTWPTATNAIDVSGLIAIHVSNP